MDDEKIRARKASRMAVGAFASWLISSRNAINNFNVIHASFKRELRNVKALHDRIIIIIAKAGQIWMRVSTKTWSVWHVLKHWYVSKREEHSDLEITEAYSRWGDIRERYNIRKIWRSFNLLMKPEHSANYDDRDRDGNQSSKCYRSELQGP